MKFKTSGCLLLGLALVLTLSVSARPDGRGKPAPKNAGSNQECVVSAHHEKQQGHACQHRWRDFHSGSSSDEH